MGKGRPALLTPDLKNHIAALIANNKKKWTAASLRDEIQLFLYNKVVAKAKAKGLDWQEKHIRGEVAMRLPGESAIQKYKQEAELRNSPSPLDQPWHLGTLGKYPLPPEAIPYIIAIQEANKAFTSTRVISIRQAIWISRLHPLVKELDLLSRIAWQYAFYERVSEIAGTGDFITSEYDKLLSKPKELLKRFENSTPSADYSNFKKAFEQVTLGVEYMGPGLPVDHLVIRDNKVYATFMIQGKPKQLEMPYLEPNVLLEAAKKQKVVKSIKKLKNEVTVIRFNQIISLIFENREYNEYLHNLIAGVKNERSHNTTK